RDELTRHCYRMLGAIAEAQDLVQDTFLRAWESRASFEGAASPRTWLFRIATNGCLNRLRERATRRLPEHASPPLARGETIADRIGDPIWLEPFPDERFAGEAASACERREHLALAFVAALQELAPRSRAILLLRDVVDLDAS